MNRLAGLESTRTGTASLESGFFMVFTTECGHRGLRQRLS